MRLTALGVIALAGFAACSLPGAFTGRGTESTPEPSINRVIADSLMPPPIVQVRTYSGSPIVTILAWDEDDGYFGLQSSITRDGTIVGTYRFGDHRLYMTPEFIWWMGGFAQAAIMPQARVLVGTGMRRDYYSCFYGKHCSPMISTGVAIPDSILRANPDSLVVTFFPRVYESWTLTLRRELIGAYLKTVDSVLAQTRKAAY